MIRVVLDGLCKQFGSVVALDDVDLTIHPGELFFLLGPSGCGKTTLLRCLAGFCEPDRGRIFFDDTDITRLPAHQRNTGMVFQNYALWPHMTVADNVAFGLEVRHIPAPERQRLVAQALEMVQLTEHEKRKPNELSGGQQQRVALARALVVQPNCLLLDEPLSNLDAALRMSMRAEIRRLCKNANLTAVYVTHDQKEALAMADRIGVMCDGRIKQVGIPKDLYDHPADSFVASFLGETNFLPGTVINTDNGKVRIRTAIGELVSSIAPSGMTAGRSVLCSVRPETVHLGMPPPGSENVFQGTVRETMYLGEMARYLLSVAGQTFCALELNPRVIDHQPEIQMPLWIDRDDIVVLPA